MWSQLSSFSKQATEKLGAVKGHLADFTQSVLIEEEEQYDEDGNLIQGPAPGGLEHVAQNGNAAMDDDSSTPAYTETKHMEEPDLAGASSSQDTSDLVARLREAEEQNVSISREYQGLLRQAQQETELYRQKVALLEGEGDTSEQVAQLQQQYEELFQQHQQVTEELAEVRRTHGEELESERVAGLRHAESLKQAVATVEEEKQQLEALVEKLKASRESAVSDLEARLVATQQRFTEEMEEQTETSTQKISELEQAQADQQERENVLLERLAQMQEQVEEAASELENTKAQLEQTREGTSSENEELYAQLQQVSGAKEQAETRIADLEEQLEQVRAQAADSSEVDAKLAALNEENGSLRERVIELEAAAQSVTSAAGETTEQLSAEIEGLRSQLQQSESALEQSQTALKQSQSLLEQSQIALEQARGEGASVSETHALALQELEREKGVLEEEVQRLVAVAERHGEGEAVLKQEIESLRSQLADVQSKSSEQASIHEREVAQLRETEGARHAAVVEELEGVKRELESARETAATMQSQDLSVSEQMQSLSESNRELGAKLTVMQKELSTVASQLQTAQGEVEQWKEAAAVAQSQVAERDARVEELVGSSRLHQQEVAELEEEFRLEQSTKDEEIARLNESLSAVTTQVQDLEAQVSERTSQLEALSSELNSLREASGAKEEDEQRQEELSSQIAALNETIHEKDEYIVALNARVARLHSIEQAAAVAAASTVDRSEIEAVEKRMKEAAHEDAVLINHLRNQRDVVSSRLEKTQSMYTKLKQEASRMIQAAKGELKKSREREAGHVERIQELNSSLEAAQATVERLEGENDERAMAVSDLQSKLEAASSAAASVLETAGASSETSEVLESAMQLAGSLLEQVNGFVVERPDAFDSALSSLSDKQLPSSDLVDMLSWIQVCVGGIISRMTEMEGSASGTETLRAELATSEEARLAGEKKIAMIIQEANSKIEALTTNFRKMQETCREACTREEEIRVKLEQQEEAYKALMSEKQGLEQGLADAHTSRESYVQSERSRIDSLLEELDEVKAALASRDEKIQTLHDDIEVRARERREREFAHEDALETLRNDISVKDQQISVLTEQMNEEQSGRSSRVVELEGEVIALQDKIRDLELDAHGAASLADDYARVKREYDMLVIEAQQHSEARENLQAVLDQFQQAQQAEVASLESERQKMAAALSRSATLEGEARQYQAAIEMLRQREKTLSEELSGAQKYILRVEEELGTMRARFDKTVQRLQNFHSDENVVDRRLVVKLLVTYFERSDKSEVLELMSRILRFTDEDQRMIGCGKYAKRGLVGSFMNILMPEEPSEPLEVDFASGNLADLWVEFLMKETGDSGSMMGSSVGSEITSPADSPKGGTSPVTPFSQSPATTAVASPFAAVPPMAAAPGTNGSTTPYTPTHPFARDPASAAAPGVPQPHPQPHPFPPAAGSNTSPVPQPVAANPFLSKAPPTQPQ